MGKWKTVKLGEVCSILSGFAFDSRLFTDDNATPLIRIRDVVRGSTNTFYLGEYDKKFIIKKGDYLIGMDGEFNIGEWKSDDALLNQRVCKIEADSINLNNKFLYYILPKKLKEIERATSYVTVKHLSVKKINNIEMYLPPIEIQKKIADILDRASELIEKRKAQIEKLDELTKSIFIDMFGDPVMNPKGWNIKSLESLGSVGSSKRVFAGELKSSGIPFYRGTEIGTLASGKNITPKLFISEEHYKNLCLSTGTPAIGDLLMPSICQDGRIWLVNTDRPFYFKDGRVLWIHPKKDVIDSMYLLYALKEKITADYNNIASGTTFAELKIFALKSLHIMVPPISVQIIFADVAKQVEKLKIETKQSLEKMELNYKSLMQKCFNGEIEL